MGLIKYLFKTSYKTKKNDLKDFVLARQICNAAKRSYYASYNNITFKGKEYPWGTEPEYGCIKIYVYVANVGSEHDPVVSPQMNKCKDFSEECLCNNNKCKYYERYKEYMEAKEAYEEQRKRKQHFWKRKFELVK